MAIAKIANPTMNMKINDRIDRDWVMLDGFLEVLTGLKLVCNQTFTMFLIKRNQTLIIKLLVSMQTHSLPIGPRLLTTSVGERSDFMYDMDNW